MINMSNIENDGKNFFMQNDDTFNNLHVNKN